MHRSLKKPPNTRKEPENAPDTTPFIPKGALTHTKNQGHSEKKPTRLIPTPAQAKDINTTQQMNPR